MILNEEGGFLAYLSLLLMEKNGALNDDERLLIDRCCSYIQIISDAI